jgi:protein phosphatase
VQTALLAAVRAANRRIYEAAGSTAAHAGMGTTLTVLALLAHARVSRIAHVGDSRAYLLRDGELARLTRDQTWVQDRVDAGLLTPEQARTHPLSALLTGALGTHDDVDIETVAGDIHPGDLFLLCSDGLTAVLEDADLLRLLSAGLPPDAAATRLVDEANLRGGPDNITVLLIRAVEQAP